MKRGIGIVGTAMTGAAMLFWFASSAAAASHAGPHNRRGGRGPTYSVAEPSTIALLGAGLVALGVYAKRKNHKKS
ncbi:MAG: PEP-CTERM sorting domain-containing protein [Candidatus Aminicenantes bacterium]|nr:PEP-CTERM sorting domain-containing protein [Candidatus Aminicenantes bacterium]